MNKILIQIQFYPTFKQKEPLINSRKRISLQIKANKHLNNFVSFKIHESSILNENSLECGPNTGARLL